MQNEDCFWRMADGTATQADASMLGFFGDKDNGQPLLNIVGLEKSGPFVEHATQIESLLKPNDALLLSNDYIYRYVQPGDPTEQSFGRNTYYGAKVIFKGPANDMYVATVPTGDHKPNPLWPDLFNVGEVLTVTSQLRCSMYDNAGTGCVGKSARITCGRAELENSA